MKKDENEYSGIRMMHVYVDHVSLNYLRLGLFLMPVRSRKSASVSFFVNDLSDWIKNSSGLFITYRQSCDLQSAGIITQFGLVR